MSVIKEILAATAVVPLDQEPRIARRRIRERHYTIVRVKDHQGLVGTGFTYSGIKAGHLTTLAVRDLLRDVVIGREVHQVEAIWEDMFHESLLHGRRGLVLRAISAMDIALWDLMARQAGVPLHRLLGSCRQESVPAYASGGYYLEGKSTADLAAEVRGYVDQGFKAVKLKVGRAGLREDLDRVKACREAVGPDVELFLDANNAWRDAPSAIKAIRAFEEVGIDWLEEPLFPDDIEASAVVAKAVQVPIATGEIEATRWGFKAIIQAGAAAIIQPDAVVCGGITEWRKIAAMAAAGNIPVAPHAFAELHVQLVASAPNAIWVEYFTDDKILNFVRLLEKPLEVRDGLLMLPDSPGLGLHWDEDALDRFALDGWS